MKLSAPSKFFLCYVLFIGFLFFTVATCSSCRTVKKITQSKASSIDSVTESNAASVAVKTSDSSSELMLENEYQSLSYYTPSDTAIYMGDQVFHLPKGSAITFEKGKSSSRNKTNKKEVDSTAAAGRSHTAVSATEASEIITKEKRGFPIGYPIAVGLLILLIIFLEKRFRA